MPRSPGSADRADIYTRVTNEIVAAIEAGAGDWAMPWHHDGAAVTQPQNVSAGRRYRGINVLALWIAAEIGGYAIGIWGTYRQWLAAGGQVRKGEHGTTVVLFKETGSREDNHYNEEESARRRMIARAFTVFNIAQVDGCEPTTSALSPAPQRFDHAETFVAALGVPVVTGSYDAHYRISTDQVFMPPAASFDDLVAHMGTLIHEMGHATGAAHRLDRNLAERFKEHSLAMEECVAELTASFILADLGIAHHPRPDHAAYVASWLEARKSDPRAIFTAASKAQQAADWMHAQQPHAKAALSQEAA